MVPELIPSQTVLDFGECPMNERRYSHTHYLLGLIKHAHNRGLRRTGSHVPWVKAWLASLYVRPPHSHLSSGWMSRDMSLELRNPTELPMPFAFPTLPLVHVTPASGIIPAGEASRTLAL